MIYKVIFLAVFSTYLFQSQVYGASFADLTAQARQCDNFLDCEENECCVVARSHGVIGKREEPALAAATQKGDNRRDSNEPIVKDGPDAGNSSASNQTLPSDASDAQIIEYLRQLESLKKLVNEHNKQDPEIGKALAALSEKNGLKTFLENFNGNIHLQQPKRGVCRSLGAEGERCVNYLNGPVCPCGDDLDCKVDQEFQFMGFGAISGLHDLVCGPI